MQKHQQVHIEHKHKKIEPRLIAETPAWEQYRAVLEEGRKLIKKGFKQPQTEVYETETEVVVRVYMPGVKEEELEIHATENAILVKAHVKIQKATLEHGRKKIHREEKGFYRFIALPEPVNPEKIMKTYKEETLELKMPKRMLGEPTLTGAEEYWHVIATPRDKMDLLVGELYF